MSTALVSLTTQLAKRLDIAAGGEELVAVLKATAFKGPASDAQMTALMVVANHVQIDADGCWNWTGATSRGYGQLTHKGIHQTAHRFVYAGLVGVIDGDNWILHRCDNRLCVNPQHLYQGTPVDNRADMLNRERWAHPWGKRENCAKGHNYETGGFYLSKTDGSRVCRTCQREAKRAQRAEMRIAA